ncbi:MAG TPA: carotenoid oxygenase family protein [Candidatus Angelobacter sp.]
MRSSLEDSAVWAIARPTPIAGENGKTDDFAPGIEAAFPHEFQECDCAVESTGNPLPDFLRGTYYLNGPARFGFGDLIYQHWLDGDGMICALCFEKNLIRLRSRYIRCRKFEDERIAGRPLYRTFGTSFTRSRLNRVNNGLESPVNVSVYSLDGRLLALGEQGLPWELDPKTLETRGQCNFNGRLNDASPFSAHPKIDQESGEMFNFGVFFSTQAPRLYFYCFGRDGLRYRKAIPLEHLCSVHDFSLSRHYAVFYLSPYLLDVSAVLHDGKSVMDSLHWEPELGSRLVILSRRTGEAMASIPIGNRYCLHLINSFEQGDRLVVDVLEFDEPLYSHYRPLPNLFQCVSSGGPVRFVIDLKSRELVERIDLHYSKAPDFPAIDPKRAMHFYGDFWMLGISATGHNGRKFFDQLVHASWNNCAADDIYQSPPMRYLGGEPVFVGAPGTNEGVIICQEFDALARKSTFLVFEAAKVAKGPIARIPLEHHLHLGFHAMFLPA